MTREKALEILGLDPDASLSEAREAYRELAKVYHPDKNLASNATVMFRIISDAWEFIQNTAGKEHAEAERRRKQTEEARQQDKSEATQAEEIHRHTEKEEVEKKIKRYCYIIWSIPSTIGSIGILTESFTDGELIAGIIVSLMALFMVPIVYGWCTAWVIIKIRKYIKSKL